MASVEPNTPKEPRIEMLKASRGGKWGRGIPFPSQLGGLREHSKLPQRGPGQSRGEKRFYCFLSVSKRLSLQRLFKINVVHSRPLIEKKWVCSMGRVGKFLPVTGIPTSFCQWQKLVFANVSGKKTVFAGLLTLLLMPSVL